MQNIPRPILIGTIALNSGEEIRVELSTYNRCNIFNVRRWYRAKDGNMKPTPKGLAASIEHLPALKTLMRKALKRAKRDGLLPNGDGDE